MCLPVLPYPTSYIDSAAAVLAYLNEKTSHLDVGDMVNALKTPFLPSSTSPDIRTGQAVYTVLGHTPMEYLPKSVRIDLTKKAVILDRQIVPTLLADDCSMDVLSLSREYISRSLAHAAVFDRLVQWHTILWNLADSFRGNGHSYEVLPRSEVEHTRKLPEIS